MTRSMGKASVAPGEALVGRVSEGAYIAVYTHAIVDGKEGLLRCVYYP